MKKILIFLAMVSFLVPTAVLQGQDVSIRGGLGYPLQVVVKGRVPYGSNHVVIQTAGDQTRKKGALLGVTAIINGEDFDFPVEVVKGRFNETYTIPTWKIVQGSASRITWVVSLWRTKFTPLACSQLNGVACSNCKLNGYHLARRQTYKALKWSF